MNVQLQTINFNYDPDPKKTGAFNLRINETQPLVLPEWRPDVCPSFECSPVAYSINDSPKKMKIQASFKVDGVKGSVKIRAVADPPDHVLGDVPPQSIPGAGSSAVVTLNLPGASISSKGIGIHDLTWRWQFSDSGIWKNFQTTKHRIYTVLYLPTDPWKPESRDATEIHQPWTEVLDQACVWAVGEIDPDEAARRINDRVNGLGPALLTKSLPSFYAHARFDCTKFLELLRTGVGEQRVNCDDCATIVSTFSNILGSDLWQSSMGLTFRTNQILQIGDVEFGSTVFVHHSAAWKGACLENDILFDAFLQVDSDGAPNIDPFTPVIPSGVIFGAATSSADYLNRLAATACRPVPDDIYPRQRRPLGASYLGAAAIGSPEAMARLEKEYAFETWPKEENENKPIDRPVLNLQDFLQTADAFNKWKLLSSAEQSDEQFTTVIQGLLWRDENPSNLIALNMYQCRQASRGNRLLLQILATFNQPLQRWEGQEKGQEIGEIGFAEGGGFTILFRRGVFIGIVGNAGKRSQSTVEFALALDRYFLRISGAGPSPHNGSSSQTQQQDSAKLKEKTMAHKFAHKWRAFAFNPEADPPTLASRGIIDLRNLSPEGILTDGKIEFPPGPDIPITGSVTEVGGITAVRLNRTDGLAHFEGFLTLEAGKRLVVLGKLITDTSPTSAPSGPMLAPGQNEEPWVITKP